MLRILSIALIAIGLVLWGTSMMRDGREDFERSTVTEAQAPDPDGGFADVGLPLVAALTFASGIVLFAVSMGRWNQPRRHSAPGDAVVDPEAHDKMDHV
jgi:hypothetical protein